LVGRQEGHPACKKTERWGAGMVICLERGADLHMAQLMPLPLAVSCFSKIQLGFTFLVPAYPGSPGKRSIKWVCVCVMEGEGLRHRAAAGQQSPPSPMTTTSSQSVEATPTGPLGSPAQFPPGSSSHCHCASRYVPEMECTMREM